MPATRPALIGGFVLGGIVLATLAILLFGSAHLFTRETRAVVYFRGSVAGLSVGAPVTFRGVRVGSVQTISLLLDPTTVKASIPVYLSLEAERVVLTNGRDATGHTGDLRKLINAGLRAQLGMQSFVTGQLQVDLDFRPGTPAVYAAPNDDIQEIPAVASELQQLKDQITGLPVRALVEHANQTLVAINKLTDTLQNQLVPMIQDAHATLATTRDTLQTASQAIASLQTSASATLEDYDRLAVDGRRQLDDKGARLGRILGAADQATHDLDTAIVTINGMTELRSPLRANLEATLRDLSSSASNLRSLSSDLERNPAIILRGRSN